ncbi:hypothetical protein IJ818_01480 [bacterium]|nr:hypothetical protein [bacterium]
MALDGFSLSQVGLGQDKTSAQMAANTEHEIRQNLGTKNVDQIANTDSEKAVTLDEEKEKDQTSGKPKKKGKRRKSKEPKVEDPYTVELNSQDNEVTDLDFYTKFSDKLGIRLNKFSEVIELYNRDTDKTVETITAKEMIKLIDRLKISSGVLVNKKI